MNKIVITLAVLAIIAGGLWAARTYIPTKENLALVAPSENLKAEKTFFDFGSISMKAGKVSHGFKIQNSGSEPETISQISTSCMCTSATLEIGSQKFGPYGMPGHGFNPRINVSLEPGEEAEVQAIFDPNAHGPAGIGLNERAIYLETKAGGVLELRLSATVTP